MVIVYELVTAAFVAPSLPPEPCAPVPSSCVFVSPPLLQLGPCGFRLPSCTALPAASPGPDAGSAREFLMGPMRMDSSYKIRRISSRGMLPDGENLRYHEASNVSTETPMKREGNIPVRGPSRPTSLQPTSAWQSYVGATEPRTPLEWKGTERAQRGGEAVGAWIWSPHWQRGFWEQ